MTMGGFITLVLLVLLLIWIYYELGGLPGRTARKREHPQADAINVLGWIGLLFGGAPWLIALVWAYTRSPMGSVTQQRTAEAESDASA